MTILPQSLPERTLLVYAQGLSQLDVSDQSLLATSNTPVLDKLCAEGCTGSLWAQKHEQSAATGSLDAAELLQLLAVDNMQSDESSSILAKMYPGMKFMFITPSSEHHTACQRLSMDSYLLCKSSLSPSLFIPIVKEQLTAFAVVIVHLRVDMLESGSASSSFQAVQQTVNLLEEIMSSVSDNSTLLKVVVTSWNEPELLTMSGGGTHQVDRICSAYDDVDHIMRKRSQQEDTRVFTPPLQSKNMRNGFYVPIMRLPLSVLYHHIGSVRKDMVQSFNEFEVYRASGNLSIGCWHLMKEIGFKLGFLPKYGA